MKRVIVLSTAAAAILTVTVPAAAQNRHWNHNEWRDSSWKTIAYTRVDGHDTDTIRVPGTARYHQMRLCVFNGPIEVRDVNVRFRNGGRQDISVRKVMRPGTCSRNLDLSGNRRDVTAVRLKYTPLARHATQPIVRVQVR